MLVVAPFALDNGWASERQVWRARLNQGPNVRSEVSILRRWLVCDDHKRVPTGGSFRGSKNTFHGFMFQWSGKLQNEYCTTGYMVSGRYKTRYWWLHCGYTDTKEKGLLLFL
jgi:hypothetical protein